MIITQTPCRISLAGGGTDFASAFREIGGAVLSLAIDKYVYVIIKERYDDDIYLNYSKKEIVQSLNDIEHELIREAMRFTGVRGGVEITCLADIPAGGTGLGSSGSFTVGMLNALYAFQGVQKTAGELAQAATTIERDILTRPIGLQDQYISAFGNFRFFEFKADGGIANTKLDIPLERQRELTSELLLFWTNTTRRSSTILEEQEANIAKNLGYLERIKQYTYEMVQAILQHQFQQVGKILHETWELKKQLASGVSNDQIDAYYQSALKAGAVGGKIAGAGGGGFLLLYCPREKQSQLRSALPLRELPFLLERDGSKVVFNVSRYGWKI